MPEMSAERLDQIMLNREGVILGLHHAGILVVDYVPELVEEVKRLRARENELEARYAEVHRQWMEDGKLLTANRTALLHSLDASEEAQRKTEVQRDRYREVLESANAQFPLEDYGVQACEEMRAALAEVEEE